MRLARRWMVGPLVLLTAIMCIGCGGSGSGGGLPGLCLTFQAAGTAAASRVIATEASSACDEVEVSVDMTGVNDVYTVSFDVTFDPLVVTYEGFSVAGSHLGSDSADVNVLETTGPGSVSLGVTRINTSSGINFTGTEPVVRLIFSRVSGAAPDMSSFTFSSTQVLGSETPPVEKNGIQWFGGLLVIG